VESSAFCSEMTGQNIQWKTILFETKKPRITSASEHNADYVFDHKDCSLSVSELLLGSIGQGL
jgi:hypothetical protein